MTMRISTIWNSNGAGTKLRQDEILLKSGVGGFTQDTILISDQEGCKRFLFVELPQGYISKKDFAARKQVCVILSGRIEIETDTGDLVELDAGDVIRLEDTDYETAGRRTRVMGSEPARVMVVQIE